MKNHIKSSLFGVVVGDALGVPVEFKSREYLKQNPVTDMIGYGSHNQPAGTWSDDSSLTFCLVESLCKGYDLQDLANRFVKWYEYAYWTPRGEVFDIGITTSQAIQILQRGAKPILAGGTSEDSNGNGSLMRILPLVFYVQNLPIARRYQIVKDVSALTHAHIRSVLACLIYVEMALQIIKGNDKWEAYARMQSEITNFLNDNAICSQYEIDKFYRILDSHANPNYKIMPIYEYFEAEIQSSGYVLHSLEASIWCLLKANTYKETVLMAVNLGKDTDTTGAIAGGLAGLLYGFDAIPVDWTEKLARKNDIEDLAERFYIQTTLKC